MSMRHVPRAHAVKAMTYFADSQHLCSSPLRRALRRFRIRRFRITLCAGLQKGGRLRYDDRGMSGTLVGPSAYFMKSPPLQYPDDTARELLEGFISGSEDVEAPITLP